MITPDYYNCPCRRSCTWAIRDITNPTECTWSDTCMYRMQEAYGTAADKIEKAVDEFTREAEKTRKKRKNRKVWGRERFENPPWERIPKIVRRTKYQKPGHRWRKG